MPINLKKIFALHHNVSGLDGFKTHKFKDEAFRKSPEFKIVPIKETIHFKALSSNDFSEYEKYILESGQKEHSKEKFIRVQKEINELSHPEISLIYSSELDCFLITDGLHRTCASVFSGRIKERIEEGDYKVYFDKQSWFEVKMELQKTVGSCRECREWSNRTNHGYHSFNIGNIALMGQRTPKKRLEKIRHLYNFKEKSILDLGCNTGGMLFHLPEIKKGVGIDIDQRCIACANKLKKIFRFDYDLSFYAADLNKQINIEDNFDAVFLMSLKSWIKNWEGLYRKAAKTASTIFLETNNDEEGKEELALFKELNYEIELITDRSADDTTGNFRRKTYMLKTKVPLV